MIDAEKLSNEFTNLIGWRKIPSETIILDTELNKTESGEYYQSKHPALRLKYIQSILEDGRDISDYLQTKVRDSSIEMINDLITKRQVGEYGKTILEETQLLNKFGWLGDKIFNESRFVGFQIRLFTGTGLKSVINKIGLQIDGNVNMKLYIFHTSKKEPIKTYDINYTGTGSWKWINSEIELFSFDSEYNGGAFVIGYYQDDLGTSNAINNTDFDFDKGVCGGCNVSHSNAWKSIKNNFDIYPIYISEGNYTKGEMFNLNDVIYTGRKSYGLNLRLSVYCDLTDFFIRNKMLFKNLLGYKVALTILNDIKFSNETNFIEENLKHMILHDLDGHKETKSRRLVDLYSNELKAVEFNIQGVNSKCLPCRPDYEPVYGTF